MNKIGAGCFLAMLLSLWQMVFAQTTNPSSSDSSRFYPGIVSGLNLGGIWAHSDEVNHLAQSQPIQLFTEFHFQNPRKNWHRKMGSASAGLALVWVHYRNSTLGNTLALIPFLEPRLRPNWSVRLGTGVAWNLHPFSLSNHQNLMLGSPITMAMHAQTNWMPFYKWRKQNQGQLLAPLRLGIGLTHFSNGAFQVPNLGINLFFLSLGYGIGEAWKNPHGQPDEGLESSTWKIQVSGSLGLVQKFPVLGPHYLVYQLQGRIRRNHGYYHSFGFGLDAMYNASYQAIIREDSTKGTRAACLGIPFSYELRVSTKLRLLAELGWYAYKSHNLSPALYQRYGLRYFWNAHLFSAYYLKAHKGKAECLEWNLGWEF